MQITKIKIRLTSDFQNRRTKAVASIWLNKMVSIHGIRVVAGKGDTDDLKLEYPMRKDEFGKARIAVHPANEAWTRKLEDAIFSAYRQVLEAPSELDLNLSEETFDSIPVTHVHIRPSIDPYDPMCAQVGMVLGDGIVLRGAKIWREKAGNLRIALPARTMKRGDEISVCRLAGDKKSSRKWLLQAILPHYDKAVTAGAGRAYSWSQDSAS